MTATTLPALHRACVLAPADMQIREVYAEAMEDAGQLDRAEFVRLQLELGQWGIKPRAYGNYYVDCRNREDYPGTEAQCHSPPFNGSPAVCAYHELRARERALLQAHDNEWLPRCLADMDSENARHGVVAWHAGFPDTLICDAATWLAHGPKIVAATPVVKVTLIDREPHENDGYTWFRQPVTEPYFRYTISEEMQHTAGLLARKWSSNECLLVGWRLIFRTRAIADAFASAVYVQWARLSAELDVRCEAYLCNEGVLARERCNDGSEVVVKCKVCGGTGWRVNEVGGGV